ncbi:unnamed protein product [Ectocarpus sp. 6 AP-2014]
MDESHGTGYEVTGRCQGGEPWTAFVFHLEPTALQALLRTSAMMVAHEADFTNRPYVSSSKRGCKRPLGVSSPEGGENGPRDSGPWAVWEALAVKLIGHPLLPRVPDTREMDYLEREYRIWSKTMEGHSGTTPYNSYAGASAAVLITGAVLLDGALKWAQRRWRLSSSTNGDRAARHVYEDWAKAGAPFGASNSGTRSSSVRCG